MAKASAREKIMMLSTGKRKNGKDTKFSYTTYKNKRNTADKVELKKFDPLAYNATTGKLGVHVLFKEKKIPK